MTTDRWRRIEALYHEMLGRPVDERAAALVAACPGDAALQAEVQSLLDQPEAGFLATSALDVAAHLVSPAGSQLTGRRIGVFEVQGLLGVGGMGEVYRARDTRLGREVAIKILPRAFKDNPDRLARFEREARVLASLNHPHIGAIYGLEEAAGVIALVMELVEGEDLSQQIARGSIPLDEALPIAKQLAEALEAAHDHGIIHRDLKPANIKITPDGTVKVLDFGLAKAFEGPASAGHSLPSPTQSGVATRAGVILGTAAYMSPEQARGKPIDKRTDIWAFGCVLYEMLTGRCTFAGDGVSEVLAAVLTREPDLAALPATAPPSIRRLLRRCLHKDRHQRLRDIGDAGIEIQDALAKADPEVTVVPVPHADHRSRERIVWISTLALITLIAVVALVRAFRPAPPAPEMRVQITTPPTSRQEDDQVSMAISPDGLKIVFATVSAGRSQLWLRSLDSVSARLLAGTELAVRPFWSPDSRSVGFFADSQLKRIDIDGGSIQTLANAPLGSGGAWNHDDTILFAPIFSGPIFRIRATGGEPSALTRLEAQQASHRYPQFLPDGRRFFYYATGPADVRGVYLSDLEGSTPRRVLDAEMAVVHGFSNQLLFVRQGTLFAQRFDLAGLALTGNPFPVAEQVAAVSVSDAGPIAYRSTGDGQRRQFVWLDRAGREMGRVGDPDTTPGGGHPSLSPAGGYVALHRTVDGNLDIWLLEMARGVLSRFTSENAANHSPNWSPDGSRIVFNSDRNGVYDLYLKSATGAGNEELLLATPQNKSVTDWSADGRFLLYRSVDPTMGHDLWALPLDGDKKPFAVVRSSFNEPYGQFSPDGKWIAYQSNESGRAEVYVQPFPGPGTRVPISTNGGAQMRWRRDGKELFYIALDSHLMAVPVRPGPNGALEPGAPVPLFAANVGDPVPQLGGYDQAYTISPDGQQFLMNTITEEASASPITVILNWKAKP